MTDACDLRELVASGALVISLVETVGYIEIIDELLVVQNKSYERPTILIAKSMKREEEIPDGTIVVLTPNMPDIADVWSCGVTLYVMLVGAYPFEDPNEPKDFQKTIQVVCFRLNTQWKLSSVTLYVSYGALYVYIGDGANFKNGGGTSQEATPSASEEQGDNSSSDSSSSDKRMVQVSGPALIAIPKQLSPPSFQSPQQILPLKFEKQGAEAQPDLPQGQILLSAPATSNTPLDYTPPVALIPDVPFLRPASLLSPRNIIVLVATTGDSISIVDQLVLRDLRAPLANIQG
ncbi:hypothetical protein Fmac_008039 [Flemingia macrophylla]|uniref:Alpha-glucan water dikinase phosphohistidine-like domain-containing protein n=1 Tax=Flemingia macrophylla TaxID=520843 RepID=A0ABD1MWA0_9FABA